MTANAGRFVARTLKSLAIGKGDPFIAMSHAESSRWTDGPQIKAAIEAATLSNSPGITGKAGTDLIAAVRPRTLIGRLTAARIVPLKTRVVFQTAGANAYWVDQASPKPITLGRFSDSGTLEPNILVAISVISNEIAQASDAEAIITRDLESALVTAADGAFVDPANAGIPDQRPRSITYGAQTIAATSELTEDIADALAAFQGDLTTAVWMMHPLIAARLNLRGEPFDTVHALGGSLVGLPVLTSSAVPLTSNGSPIVLVDAAGVEIGGFETASVRATTNTALQMESETTEGETALVSLYQTNCVALLAETHTDWRVRPESVVVIEGVS